MTHRYTLALGGVIEAGARHDRPAATAVAWAEDTILALGSDTDVAAISRGDSHVVRLRGARVVPVGPPLEVGAAADFDVVRGSVVVAAVRSGRVVSGRLPGLGPHEHGAGPGSH